MISSIERQTNYTVQQSANQNKQPCYDVIYGKGESVANVEKAGPLRKFEKIPIMMGPLNYLSKYLLSKALLFAFSFPLFPCLDKATPKIRA